MSGKTICHGYSGRLARIDLSTGNISLESPPEDYYRRYLGGRGFILPILLRELQPGVDPLGPSNKLVFSLGPLTGHPLTGSGRNSVGSISPLTGGFGEAEVGGFWGARLRRAGFDAVIVEGVSDRPVYVFIDNGAIEIREADKIWGRYVHEAERAIKDELGDEKISTATIGPGGEKLVRFACIMNDTRFAAGRTGMGAVMGSKKLKAVAVRGDQAPPVADRGKLVELSRWMAKNYRAKSHVCDYGTGASIEKYEETGNLPVRNFTGGRFFGVKEITPQRIFGKSYVEKRDGCFGCPIRCKRRVRIERPWKVEAVYGGPEYETLAALGSNCGINNLEAIIKASDLCNRFGIDTISTGVCVSFAMECFENGILDTADTGGLELRFGHARAMVKLVRLIAERKGIGDLLAEGTKRAAERIGRGAAALAMQVKGQELPMHEPRYRKAMGLHYSVHFAGGDHCTGVHDDVVRADPLKWESIDVATSIPNEELSPRKARMVYHLGLWRHLPNYLGLCLFVPWSFKQVSEAVEAVTGWPTSYWKLMKSVERGITLARILNLRQGFTAADDRLPARFATPASEGPLQGLSVDPDELSAAQKIYYQMLGWNEDGVPTHARLVELDMEWAREYIPSTSD